jgi:predicted AAA+ superfamily ATPase
MLIYERPHGASLRQRLREPVHSLNIIVGPRQVGKSTLVREVLQDFNPDVAYVSAEPADLENTSPIRDPLPNETHVIGYSDVVGRIDGNWLVQQWQAARRRAANADGPFILAVDEIQKVPRWSEIVKGLWDQDRAASLNMHVILLGSSPLLVQHGLSESLMGRFELLRMGHWSYPEMHSAFGMNLDEYIYFGGYPGPANSGLWRDERRWRAFVSGSLIEPSIEKDIFELNRVDRPALLKQLFWLGCDYSAQILSLDNMAQNLRERGEGEEAHTGTVAKYLDLLGKAGLLAGLQKFSGSMLRQRTSPPKLLALNNALMAVASGYDFASAKADRSLWGRMVESAVGAHLFNSGGQDLLTYWRNGKLEVDFVLSRGRRTVALEVKSGRASRPMPGLAAFSSNYPDCRRLVVGEGGIALVDFLSEPAEYWLSDTQ